MEPREPDGSEVVEAAALRERTQQRLQDSLRFRHLNHICRLYGRPWGPTFKAPL